MIEFDPLTGDPIAKTNRALPQSAVAAQPIDTSDPDALRQLAKSVLVEIIQTAPRNASLVGAIRELLDRIDGKPAQQQTLDVNMKSDIRLVSYSDKEIIEHYIARRKNGE